MPTAPSPWKAPWTDNSLRPAPHVTPASCTRLGPLRLVLQKLRCTLALRQRVPTPPRNMRTPRSTSTYTMLVESDVQRGMRGILP